MSMLCSSNQTAAAGISYGVIIIMVIFFAQIALGKSVVIASISSVEIFISKVQTDKLDIINVYYTRKISYPCDLFPSSQITEAEYVALWVKLPRMRQWFLASTKYIACYYNVT